MSQKYQLSQIDWYKILIGLLVALSGAALTYLSEFVLSVEWGNLQPLIVAGMSVLVNFLRKFLTVTQ